MHWNGGHQKCDVVPALTQVVCINADETLMLRLFHMQNVLDPKYLMSNYFIPRPPNRLLKRATWPPESRIRCWPVHAGWVFGSISSFNTSPALPQVERVLCRCHRSWQWWFHGNLGEYLFSWWSPMFQIAVCRSISCFYPLTEWSSLIGSAGGISPTATISKTSVWKNQSQVSCPKKSWD